MKAILALEDGRIFNCKSFTGPGETAGEAVFNTSMTGYQEVLTDPSYAGQLVTMTYPLIGNYGITPLDVESAKIQVAGFIIKEYQPYPSNFRSEQHLADYLAESQILGICDLDTRALTRHIRNTGAMRAVISTYETDSAVLVQKARAIPEMSGLDLVQGVTTKTPYYWKDNKSIPIAADHPLDETLWQEKGRKYLVVAFDFGIKFNILRYLEKLNCEIVVLPATTPAAIVQQMAPEGIFFSNGPGDPEPVTYAIETIKALLGFRPMFGICLGHQLLALALGAKTYKLKFGHRGANQPVKNLKTTRVEITSQNHGFAVSLEGLTELGIEPTHINLNENSLEGFKHNTYPVRGVQYHPEASPGPHDAEYYFQDFITSIKTFKK